MKDIILYPPILGAIVVGLVSSYIIVFYFTKDKAIASIFKQLNEYAFLFIVSGVALFPFTHLNLNSLGTHEKGLYSGLFLLLVYAAVLILLRVSIIQVLTNIIILFQQDYLGIYLGLLLFSTFWSATPWLTLRAGISLVLISSFAVYFAWNYNWQQIFKLLYRNQLAIASFSAFLAIFVPSEGQTDKGWAGAIGHPIDLGNIMALTASMCLLNAIRNPKARWRSLFFLVLSIVILQLANSAGAFLVFLSLIVIIFIPQIFSRLNFLQANFLFIFILSIFAIPSIWLLGNFERTMALLGRDVTFTGRIPLWNLLIERYVRERVWFGYGYYGFWQPWRGSDDPSEATLRLIGDWTVHAHNGFLDIILNLGLVGLVLFALSFFYNTSRAIKLNFSDGHFESILPLIILTFVFMTNLSQTAIIKPNYIWFLYVLTTVKLQIDNKRKRKYADLAENEAVAV